MIKIPEHIAIIMDGNGRWAKAKGKVRTEGHYQGVKNVRDTAIYANELGVKCLTLYAFSTENWKRPEDEINYIMSLPKVFFASYLKELMEKNIRIRMMGEIERIPENARRIFLDAIEKTKNNTGMTLNFALNYGSRREIVLAARKYAEDVKNGRINDIDENGFAEYLMTDSLPEIELLIRTSGEKRLSNLLLYQLAYSEMVFSEVYWPDFDYKEFDRCIDEFNHRKRRYGGLDES
ncbi:MAG: isoprenyl transferase [Erysipelotrichaceae bacterium]|nr:isoprenyl transferase [Erysipelotrichaceae bacterium]